MCIFYDEFCGLWFRIVVNILYKYVNREIGAVGMGGRMSGGWIG